MANTTGDIRTVDEILGDEVQLALKAGRTYITLSFSCVEKLTKQWKDKLQEVWELQELNEHLIDQQKLLKEQKAELSYRCAKTITHTATKLDDATCPSCGNVVGRVRYDYCHYCGQKLDWEGQ